MENRPIVIAGALNSEIYYLVEKINVKDEKIISGYKFYEGDINGYPVVIAKTEVGIINAASCITIAIEKYNPILIFNEGTAGGITERRHKKDVIIAEEVFNINSYRSPYKEIDEGSDSTEWEYISFSDGGEDVKKVHKSNKTLFDIVSSMKENYIHGKVYSGIVGSGDAWNREKAKLLFLDKIHNVSCEDMESIAIYTVAENNFVPCISVKIMSDNELLGEEYEPKVAIYLQEFCYPVLEKIIENINKF